MTDARSWSELFSAIISHFGTSILWHIGMTRQYDVQSDKTRQNQHSTGKLICKRNIFYSETSQIACGLPVRTIRLNPLSQEGGGVVAAPPPFGFSLVPFLAFLLRLPYGQFTHPLSRYPCICEKIFQKFLP